MANKEELLRRADKLLSMPNVKKSDLEQLKRDLQSIQGASSDSTIGQLIKKLGRRR